MAGGEPCICQNSKSVSLLIFGLLDLVCSPYFISAVPSKLLKKQNIPPWCPPSFNVVALLMPFSSRSKSQLPRPCHLFPPFFFLTFPFLPADTQSPLLSWASGLLASSLCHFGTQIAITTLIPADCLLHLGVGYFKTPSNASSSLQECGKQDFFHHSVSFVQWLLPWLRVSWFCTVLCGPEDLLLLACLFATFHFLRLYPHSQHHNLPTPSDSQGQNSQTSKLFAVGIIHLSYTGPSCSGMA